MQVNGWKMDEHDKGYGMKDMDSMSRSNIWKDYGSMQEDVWITRKGHEKCIWVDERKVKVKIKDGKG